MRPLLILCVCSMNGCLPSRGQTRRKRALLPFLPFNRICFPKERLSLKNTDTFWTRKNAPDLIRKRSNETTKRPEGKKDRSNRRDLALGKSIGIVMMPVTWPGPTNGDVASLYTTPSRPPIGSFRALMVVYASFSVFGTEINLLPMHRDRSGQSRNDRVVPS